MTVFFFKDVYADYGGLEDDFPGFIFASLWVSTMKRYTTKFYRLPFSHGVCLPAFIVGKYLSSHSNIF